MLNIAVEYSTPAVGMHILRPDFEHQLVYVLIVTLLLSLKWFDMSYHLLEDSLDLLI